MAHLNRARVALQQIGMAGRGFDHEVEADKASGAERGDHLCRGGLHLAIGPDPDNAARPMRRRGLAGDAGKAGHELARHRDGAIHRRGSGDRLLDICRRCRRVPVAVKQAFNAIAERRASRRARGRHRVRDRGRVVAANDAAPCPAEGMFHIHRKADLCRRRAGVRSRCHRPAAGDADAGLQRHRQGAVFEQHGVELIRVAQRCDNDRHRVPVQPDALAGARAADQIMQAGDDALIRGNDQIRLPVAHRPGQARFEMAG